MHTSLIVYLKSPLIIVIYTLSLHDALPILLCLGVAAGEGLHRGEELLGHWAIQTRAGAGSNVQDRKSTRLNSSHVASSYAVFCLIKKKSCKAVYLSSI